jgi:hypothetical protein
MRLVIALWVALGVGITGNAAWAQSEPVVSAPIAPISGPVTQPATAASALPVPATIKPAPPVLPPVLAAQPDIVPSPEYQESLAVEVAMMYYKLLNQQPNFDFLVFANPVFRNDPAKMGDSEMIKQERAMLKAVYDSFTPNSIMFAEREVDVEVKAPDFTTIRVTGIEPYEPFTYEMTTADQYGIFIRNARDTLRLKAPFITGSPRAFIQKKSDEAPKYIAELTLKPLIADKELFETEEGDRLKIIVADVVEIKLYNEDKSVLLLQKRFKDWSPVVPKAEESKKEELIQAPEMP